MEADIEEFKSSDKSHKEELAQLRAKCNEKYTLETKLAESEDANKQLLQKIKDYEIEIKRLKENNTQNSSIKLEEHTKILDEKNKAFLKEKDGFETAIDNYKKDADSARISNSQKSKEIADLYGKLEESKARENKMANEIEDLKSQAEIIRKQLQAEIKDLKKSALADKKEESKGIEEKGKNNPKITEKDKSLLEKLSVKLEELNSENHKLKEQATKNEIELQYLKDNALSKYSIIMYYAKKHIEEHRIEFDGM